MLYRNDDNRAVYFVYLKNPYHVKDKMYKKGKDIPVTGRGGP
jgi:hypothetical protein